MADWASPPWSIHSRNCSESSQTAPAAGTGCRSGPEKYAGERGHDPRRKTHCTGHIGSRGRSHYANRPSQRRGRDRPRSALGHFKYARLNEGRGPANLANIKLLALDVDGILTDGRVWFDGQGEQLKPFHTQDGLGIKLLLEAGIEVAIITGRISPMVDYRARQLGIMHVIQGRDDKLSALKSLLEHLELDLAQTAYMGTIYPSVCLVGGQCRLYGARRGSLGWPNGSKRQFVRGF